MALKQVVKRVFYFQINLIGPQKSLVTVQRNWTLLVVLGCKS